MSRILRVPADPGYLSNKRMALEIAIGLAHLSGRALALPVDDPIGWGPRPARPAEESGTPSCLRDLYELPIPVLGEEGEPAPSVGWPVPPLGGGGLAGAVLVDPPERADHPDVAAFACGRRVLTLDHDAAEAPVVETPRALANYSCFFFLEADRRASLFALLEGVAPRAPYGDLGRALADELAPFNAAHIRRTDLLTGVRDHRRVTPWMLRDTLAERFPAELRLVVCTEADPASDVFLPLRSHFAEVVFLNEHVLATARDRFDALARHDDSALALVSQEVATRADGFVGTLGSTFTGIIHRQRRRRDHREPFLFTADVLGAGEHFVAGEYREVGDGPFSWNRVGHPLEPETISWIREWPEAVP